jgi:hypothetical protein
MGTTREDDAMHAEVEALRAENAQLRAELHAAKR